MNLGNSLFHSLGNRIDVSQMQSRYNMIISPGIVRIDTSGERDVQKIYDPIICDITKCRYSIEPSEISDNIERCK